MSGLFLTLIVVVTLLAVSFLIMSVGLIRGKTFTSCGCASITYKGEKIRCSACPAPEGEACVEKPQSERAG